jgi:hypothetical protein
MLSCEAAVMQRLSLALVFLSIASLAGASDVELGGAEGHPRGRFPLAVHLPSAGEAALDGAVRRAVQDWNTVAESAIGTRVFAESADSSTAHVLVEFRSAAAARIMGATRLGADGRGVITLPVRITVFPPAARGQTPAEVLLYQVVAHELGHALGLPHTRDPRSLMCCVYAGIDFNDAAVREAYVTARRQPDVRSSAVELTEHYRKFWERGP